MNKITILGYLKRSHMRILPLMICGTIFCFFAFMYQGHLSYLADFQMFLLTGRYFVEMVSHPGGFSEYLGEAVTQFYVYPVIGAAFIALLLYSMYRLLIIICDKIKPQSAKGWMPLMPVIVYAGLLCDENFMLAGLCAVVLTLSISALHLSFAPLRGPMAYYILMAAIYWMCGLTALIFAAIVYTYNIIRTDDRYRVTLVYLAGALALMVIMPIVASTFLQYPLSRLAFGGVYYNFITIYPTVLFLEYALIALLPAICILSGTIVRRGPWLKHISILPVMLTAVVMVSGYVDLRKEEVLAYDRCIRYKQWDKVIEMADRRNPDMPSTVACLNLALARNNQLLEKMFCYYQNGTGGLMPDYVRDFTLPMIYNEIYYHLGFINTSRRFAFEAMEAIPGGRKSVRAIKRLAETNVINGKYEVARKYLTLLEQTLFYKYWARRMRGYIDNEQLIDTHPEYGELRKIRVDDDFLFSQDEKDMMLGLVYTSSHRSRLQYEYLQAYYLLSKDLKRFLACQSLKKEFPVSRPSRTQQEAICMVVGTGREELDKWMVAGSTLADYNSFMASYRNFPKDPQMLKNFDNTYWHYFIRE